MASVIIVHVWRLLPLATMIRIAGMNSIPREIIEAAQIDGAGYYRRLFQIVLPLLLPVISVTILFSTLFTFTDMTVVWVLTKGGPPPHATQVLASYAFLKRHPGRRPGPGGGDRRSSFSRCWPGLAAIVLRLAKKAVVT